MRAVNLLPRDDSRPKIRLTRGNQIAIAVAIVAVGLLAASFMMAAGNVKRQRAALDAAQAELAATPPPAAKPTTNTDQALVDAQSQRLTALSSALAGRLPWDRVLRELSSVLPDDVWLTSLTASSPHGISGGSFNVKGETYSQESVARLLTRLSLVPDLTNVELTSSQRNGAAHPPTVAFTIVATVRAPGTSS
jgi:Tfp pilus assembly protein PilN